MERWIGKVAVVTGASAGMGECLAIKLVKAGMQVVGLARRVQIIEATSLTLSSENGKLHARQCDMSSEQDIKSAFKWVTETLGPVHLLINAAGCNPGTDILTGEPENWKTCLDLNVIGLATACKEAVKIMLENNIDGHIINFNSLLGHITTYWPELSMYSASKHAVTAVTELLRQELAKCGKKNNIKVTNISPGAVKTDFFKDTNETKLGEFIRSMPCLTSDEVTDALMYVIGTPARVHVYELIVVANE